MNVNRVLLLGHLTRDPELRSLPNGNAVAKFGIAMNRRWTDKQTNELRDEVCFVEVDAFGPQAQLIREHFAKGKPMFLEGRLRLDQWETKTGEKRSQLKVVLDRFEFVPDGRGAGGERSVTGGERSVTGGEQGRGGRAERTLAAAVVGTDGDEDTASGGLPF